MALPTPPKLGQICHQEVAFLQIPAQHSAGLAAGDGVPGRTVAA